jgi:hypothetical protein
MMLVECERAYKLMVMSRLAVDLEDSGFISVGLFGSCVDIDVA